MTTAMSGVRAKVGRSLELLLELDKLVHEYLDTHPMDIQRQTQADRQTSVFALVVTTEPPVKLALLVGEVVHQLRSGLDHLANQLVRAAGNTPERRTSFPVLTKQPLKPLTVHGDVTPAALAVIEQLQPYHRKDKPEEHPLAVLNELWNTDKHRNLTLTTTMMQGTQIFLADPAGKYLVGGQFQTGPLGDDDIVGIFAFDGEFPSDAEVHWGGQGFLAFADEGPWGTRPVTTTLEELGR